jgi:hypothetical protein
VKIDDLASISALSPALQTGWANKLGLGNANFDKNQLALEALGDNADLSFLDLLSSLGGNETTASTMAKRIEAAKVEDKDGNKSASSSSTSKPLEPANLAPAVQPVKHSHELDDTDRLGDRFSLKSLDLDELTDTDQRYLRQSVIPNIPILMGQVPIENVFPGKGKGGDFSYRGFEISDGLADMIKHGYKTGQPIRLELDGNSALVLKIRNGQVSAEFVAADQGAALAMQNELNDLRQKMAARNLPVGSIESRYKGQQQQPDGQQGNGGSSSPDQ